MNVLSHNEKELINACKNGSLNNVRKLIKKGINMEIKDGGFTPLMVATYYGHHHIVVYLVDHGADMYAKDMYGYTPLDMARSQHHPGIANFLMLKTEYLDPEQEEFEPEQDFEPEEEFEQAQDFQPEQDFEQEQDFEPEQDFNLLDLWLDDHNKEIKIRNTFRSNKCDVCITDYSDETKEVLLHPCLHTICNNCLPELNNNKCPTCMAIIEDAFYTKSK